MIEDLFDKDLAGRPAITLLLVSATLVVSLPSLVDPRFYRLFGAVGELRYPWQYVTFAFEHGWPGFPPLSHLLVDLLLMLVVGVAAEAMLGAARYLTLTAAAVACHWGARAVTGLEANGASVFLWSYAPIVFVGVVHAKRSGGRGGSVYERLQAMLVVMWVVVPVVLGGLAMSRGVAPLLAVPEANVFHISGTIAGLAGALVWKRTIAVRLTSSMVERSTADRVAIATGAMLPSLCVVLLFLGAVGVIAI